MLQAGKSLEEAAEECGVQPATVVGYLERHVKHTGALPPGVQLPVPTCSPDDRAQARVLLAEQEADRLGSVYRTLEGRVEYVDLYLLRLEMLLEQRV